MNATPSPRATALVTVLGWISVALGAMGVASGLLQAAVLPVLQPRQMLAQIDDAGMPVPPALAWMLEHLQWLNLASILASALLLLVAWGLLRRREWGRKGFIALLVLSALGSLAGAAWFGHFMDGLVGMQQQMAGDDPVFARLQLAMRMTLWAGAIAVAVLHGWLAWLLGTAPVRAQFTPGHGPG